MKRHTLIRTGSLWVGIYCGLGILWDIDQYVNMFAYSQLHYTRLMACFAAIGSRVGGTLWHKTHPLGVYVAEVVYFGSFGLVLCLFISHLSSWICVSLASQ
eukprot:630820_1